MINMNASGDQELVMSIATVKSSVTHLEGLLRTTYFCRIGRIVNEL